MSEKVEWGFITPTGAIVGPYSSVDDAHLIGGDDAELVWRVVTEWTSD